MTTKLIKTIPVQSTQSGFNKEQIEERLKGYKKLPNKQYSSIQSGDKIRYSTNGQFKMGGVVKLVKFPQYLVCMNVIKNVSWSVQLTDPTLIIWIKTKAFMEKEKNDKEKIYQKFKEGKLVPVSKCK